MILGTFYWASLVGEKNIDSGVPCPSPHWDSYWFPGRKGSECLLIRNERLVYDQKTSSFQTS
jgi:hypothetical protein